MLSFQSQYSSTYAQCHSSRYIPVTVANYWFKCVEAKWWTETLFSTLRAERACMFQTHRSCQLKALLSSSLLQPINSYNLQENHHRVYRPVTTVYICTCSTVNGNCSHPCSYGNLFSRKIWHWFSCSHRYLHSCMLHCQFIFSPVKRLRRLCNLLHWYRLTEDTTMRVAYQTEQWDEDGL